MIVLHGVLHKDEFLLWAEKQADSRAVSIARTDREETSDRLISAPSLLPFAAAYSQLQAALKQGAVPLTLSSRQNAQLLVWLPSLNGVTLASSNLVGLSMEDLDESAVNDVILESRIVPAVRLPVGQSIELLCYCLDNEQLAPGIQIGDDLQFWALALRFAGMLVGKQQFLPGLNISEKGAAASWEPVFIGEDGDKLMRLTEAMPGACRACEPEQEEVGTTGGARPLLLKFVRKVVDCLVRKSIGSMRLPLEAQAGDAGGETSGIHKRWLAALLGEQSLLSGTSEEIAQLADQIAQWRRPVEVASDALFRLCFVLEEPTSQPDALPPIDEDADRSPASWYLRFMLQSLADPTLLLAVDDVLSPHFEDVQLLRGGHVSAREYLFRSLGQAVRLCPEIAPSFEQETPVGVALDTHAAYDFLAHKAPVLKNSGFSVQLPVWWSTKRAQVSAGIKISSPGNGFFSLTELAKFDWHLALGPVPITIDELEKLARLKVPLIQLNGVWVELNPDEIEPILRFFRQRAQQKASGHNLLRMSLGDVKLPRGVTFAGLSGDGPIVDLVSKLTGKRDFEAVPAHANFSGSLRPYQERGLSWLDFLAKVGFGACLADDMGLGKTVQTLAFVQRQWHEAKPQGKRPTLLVCPTSVLSNWQKEANKFTADLPVCLHHGLDRLRGADLSRAVRQKALVLTTYNILHRDKEDLKKIEWETVILDEAQNIKNPEANQTKAALALRANFRLALTGTPVENSVGDLWSLMNFLNRGFLGTQSGFRERFLIPIQARQDQESVQQLRQLTAPFILRRLKTDKSIAPDLPDKIERKTRCYLTREQASLYRAIVEDASGSLDSASGMKRKSIVLTTLLRLKQVCDHPALFSTTSARIAGRSGKLKLLTEMLKDVIANGESALVFTQFSQMGRIIQRHIQDTLCKEVLFLHGAVERAQRARMVERFEKRGGPPVFVLSLKAGGSGLNLVRANHVFHYDRWWNPAVEDQATDRAYRIGQQLDVQVHKYICSGTLEDSIDRMIEKKKIIASSTVGAGEGWLTELSTDELRDIFALRSEALID